MTSLLDQPLSEFRSDLERIEQLLSMLNLLKDFGGEELPLSISVSEGSSKFFSSAAEIREKIRAHTADFTVLSGSLLLYLAGRFEHFVRMNFQSVCDGYAVKCKNYSQLPNKMQKSMHWYTAEVSKDYLKYGFDETAAYGFMATYVESKKVVDGTVIVNSSCLSVTQNNMRPDILADLFKRIGIDNLWQEMSKQSVMKAFFETDKDSSAEKDGRAVLEDMMSARNGIAHPTGTPSFPDLDKIKRFSDFIYVLAEALLLVTKMHLAAFKPE